MKLTKISDFATLARERDPVCVAVVAAHEVTTLDAIVHAARDGLITARLYGDARKIASLLPPDAPDFAVIDAEDNADALERAVEDVQRGVCGALMKGDIDTATFLRAVVRPENGLRGDSGSRLSVVGFYDPSAYHKLVAVTDFGMNEAPDADAKQEIIINTVKLLRNLGISRPKVAVLSDTERVSARVPASVDAAELKRRWLNGAIPDCILEGPIPFDLAVSRAAADTKGYISEVAGDADLLVVPDIAAGNILVKALTIWGGCGTAGTVLGARVPVIMTSRSADPLDKYHSIALAAVAGGAHG
ncbi:MAG: phosphate butyryltransferase Ptb [Oscillospiraceae bacterium]|jgi:phosphotransacetylase|nr:phosphate butyryltransferase Ptb [Oscillospiraceae bacterium]